MLEEKPYRSRESNLNFFWSIKLFVINGIEKIFGYNSKDKEIINYATGNRKDGKVIVNYLNANQKYVLGIDSHNKLVFVTDNLSHHINIKHKYISDWFCLWWWRVIIDGENKVISLYWRSKVYGNVSGDQRDAMVKMLKNVYPDYTVLLK